MVTGAAVRFGAGGPHRRRIASSDWLSSAKRLAFSVWFISSSSFNGLSDRQIRHTPSAGITDPRSVNRTFVMARVRNSLSSRHLSIDRSVKATYGIAKCSCQVLSMDRQGYGESHLGNDLQQTQATGGRDGVKTMPNDGQPGRSNRRSRTLCHESRSGVAGHSLLDD